MTVCVDELITAQSLWMVMILRTYVMIRSCVSVFILSLYLVPPNYIYIIYTTHILNTSSNNLIVCDSPVALSTVKPNLAPSQTPSSSSVEDSAHSSKVKVYTALHELTALSKCHPAQYIWLDCRKTTLAANFKCIDLKATQVIFECFWMKRKQSHWGHPSLPPVILSV